ncbi:cytochrome P450 [Nocardiopsis sp. EMB25]|uniref:bifunctional cytochrome P450/NADPH--P450 reductase n=2 Tax=Nocardiopsis TaxID=2013 RepID=UPI002283FF58|nr:cytochrome P450 [Nocardiopsis sp. EMB25]MCY9783502.1 cytochrome P450 [Nocardiopsis sp. EMB25]
MTSTPTLAPIPEPQGLPLLGHTLEIAGQRGFVGGLTRMHREAGPIIRVRVPGEEFLSVTGADLVAEVCDETRFRKGVHDALLFLRTMVGDGLFTAFSDEPNWRKAHDILMPAFSLGAMRDYHDTMLDVARGLLAKWDRAGDEPVDVVGDMTRLTFDTIGRCGFGYDFGSFDRDDLHPFVTAMAGSLGYAQKRGTYLPGTEPLHVRANRSFQADVAYMNTTVDEVIGRRRRSGDTDTSDLLGRMLHTPDPVTGELLDDVNIRNQVITFLIAGHETTSGALSFALHYLTKHPEVLARAQAEVDALWGDTDRPEPTHADVGRLPYVRQILNESLRLWPTAPAFSVEPLEDTVVGGRHRVAAGTPLVVFIPGLHREPEWGDNVELFDPDRFTPERAEARPPHVFKPFGNGERACIGRQFALHEAVMVLGLLIHRYRFIDHADYELKVKETLTVKPDGFTLRLARRTGADRARAAAPTPTAAASAVTAGTDGTGAATTRRAPGTALTVLYGSNLGTCAAIARDLAEDAAEHGFAPTTAALDQAVDRLTRDAGPVLVATASYNGRPTDDAAEFVDWLEGLEPGSLDGVEYAVLGVGDRNWAATYQRVPTLIDDLLHAAGATRLGPRGAADTSGDFSAAVDAWTAATRALLLDRHGEETAGAPAQDTDATDADLPPYTVADAAASAEDQLAHHHGLRPMRVLESRELVDTDHLLGRSKRFVRLELPEGLAYRTGDHLAVLPSNAPDLVRRVADRLGLDLRRTVRITPRRRTRGALPVDRPLTLERLLSDYVELQAPATPAQIAVLADHTPCPPERRPLLELAGLSDDDFAERVTRPGVSVLDLLEDHPACQLPLEHYLGMLPELRPRRYSISSSANASPDGVDLMVAALTGPHRRGRGTYRGTASHHMARLAPGDTVWARVLPCADRFRPSRDGTPLIMVCAGTGLAPFRGAVADRVHAGEYGAALLYFGCDHPDVDFLHREELAAAERSGAVSLRPVFSEAPVDGARFVQHRLAAEAAEVWSLLQEGGRVHVCGDGRAMAPGVRDALVRIHREMTGSDPAGAEHWLADLVASERYVEDVWSG